MDRFLDTTERRSAAYRNIDRIDFLTDCLRLQYSPQFATRLLRNTRGFVRYRMHLARVSGAWCCRHRKSLGECRQIGTGSTVECRNTMDLRRIVYRRCCDGPDYLDRYLKSVTGLTIRYVQTQIDIRRPAAHK